MSEKSVGTATKTWRPLANLAHPSAWVVNTSDGLFRSISATVFSAPERDFYQNIKSSPLNSEVGHKRDSLISSTFFDVLRQYLELNTKSWIDVQMDVDLP